jgi:hypothetical protein
MAVKILQSFLTFIKFVTERQRTYNVTLRCVRGTTVVVETQQCLVCIVKLHVTVNYISN